MLPMRPTTFRRLSSVFWLLASVLGLAGCTLIPEPPPDPTRYYVLTGPAVPGEVAPSPGGLRLGLNAVELAPYLKGRAMAVRRGANELAFNDYARWAEPLDAAISSRVRAELLALPKVARVLAYPFPFDGERDFYVSIHVAQCEGAEPQPGSGVYAARFAATIEIIAAGPEARRVVRRVFTAPEAPWDGRDYGALVATLSDAVSALAHEVAAALPER